MADAHAQAQGLLKVSNKLIIPGVPVDDTEKAFLVHDLHRMGCGGMLETPWCLRNVKIVRELKEMVPNKFEGTIRGCLDKSTTELWRRMYGFQANNNGPSGRKYKYVKRVIQGSPHKHDEYAIAVSWP